MATPIQIYYDLPVLPKASDSFKTAIKSSEREIKGYVEMLYKIEDIDGTVDSSGIPLNKADICDADSFINDSRVSTNYASLENNYFQLDGSFILPNNPSIISNENTGLISDETVENTTEKTITVNSPTTTTMDKITVYFKDNIPSDITLLISYSTSSSKTIEITDNSSSQAIFDFDEITSVTSLKFTFDGFEYDDRRIRIPKIEYGLGTIYSDQDLINFSFTDESTQFAYETPPASLSLKVGNYDDKFNPINPDGIVKYLNDDMKFVSYLGVLTENEGFEYKSLGIFYFDSYVNNDDRTTTINASNLIKILKSIYITDDNNYLTTTLDPTEYRDMLNYYYMEEYDYDFYVEETSSTGIMTIYTGGIDCDYLLELLQQEAMYLGYIIQIDTENNILLKFVDDSDDKIISFDQMKNKPHFENQELYKKAELLTNEFDKIELETGLVVLIDNFTLTESPMYKMYKKDNVMLGASNLTKSCTGATATKQGSFEYYYSVKFEGTVGDDVEFTLTTATGSYTKGDNSYAPYYTTRYDGNEGTNIITGTNNFVYGYVETTPTNLKINYLENLIYSKKKYKVTFNYSGNPIHRAGDKISVETDYGYKDLFIQKIELKYDGGLSGYIEGVGN